MTTPSKPVTFAELKKRWYEAKYPPPYSAYQMRLCADDLEALEQHYIHKDLVRRWVERWQVELPNEAIGELTALLGDKP